MGMNVEPRQSIVYLLRTTQQHHVHLSAMADQKASFLIAASFVMLTILFGQMKQGGLSLPLGVLAVSTLVAAVFAVLAVMPRSNIKTIKGLEMNPLFFGHFSLLSKQEYIHTMEKIFSSDQNVYEAMLMDIYQMGKVLHERKYRYLRYSYQVFFIGLVLTAIVAVIEGLQTPGLFAG
jgi:hypothetical protein